MTTAFAFGDEIMPGLAKLVEEAGECAEVLAEAALLRAIGRLQQTAGKLMMTHGQREHWSGDLYDRLIEQLADLRAAALFVTCHCIDPEDRETVQQRINDKLAKFGMCHAGQDDRPVPAA